MSKQAVSEAIRQSSEPKHRHPLRRIALVATAAIVLYLVVGYVATIPVVGNDPYWRTLRAQPGDFGLHAETLSFPSQDDHLPLTAWYIAAR